MVRRRYYYRRTSRPKQKWAINMVDSHVVASQAFNVATGSSISSDVTVCSNSKRIDSGASGIPSAAQVLKTGRWKFKGLLTNVTVNFNYIIYLVYIPEGYTNEYNLGVTDGDDVFYRHPEWVIAWTRKDYVSIEQSNEVVLTSRLKRNLNTGDSIQIRVLVGNMGSTAVAVNQGTSLLRGTVSYCCRAN